VASEIRGRPPGRPDSRPHDAPPSAYNVALTVARSTAQTASAAAYALDDLPDRIAQNVAVDPLSGEWIWTARLDKDGYGRIGKELVHRVVYALLVGPIPAERPELDHVRSWGCTSRACLSPWHLEPCTRRENILRGRSPAAVNAAKVRCDHGHAFTVANTYTWRGHRQCRACARKRGRRAQRRAPAATVTPRPGLGRAA
jgi:hypothetical protein